MAADQGSAFRGRHFTSEVILWALRWYLAFPISYRDLSAMLWDRGVSVDHTTLFRWVQAYATTLGRRVRRHLQLCTGSWGVNETYIKSSGFSGSYDRVRVAGVAYPRTLQQGRGYTAAR